MHSPPRPEHPDRPHRLCCERLIPVPAAELYEAWTTRFDRWFAQPGTLELVAEAGRPYFFYNRNDWGRHPHYGRFLDLVEDQLIEMTWVTGDGTEVGTAGAETILRIEFIPEGEATRVRLEHSGFVSAASCAAHAENWPLALEILEQELFPSERAPADS